MLKLIIVKLIVAKLIIALLIIANLSWELTRKKLEIFLILIRI